MHWKQALAKHLAPYISSPFKLSHWRKDSKFHIVQEVVVMCLSGWGGDMCSTWATSRCFCQHPREQGGNQVRYLTAACLYPSFPTTPQNILQDFFKQLLQQSQLPLKCHRHKSHEDKLHSRVLTRKDERGLVQSPIITEKWINNINRSDKGHSLSVPSNSAKHSSVLISYNVGLHEL